MKSVRGIPKMGFWERGSWAADAALPYRLHGIASCFGVDTAVVLYVFNDKDICELRKNNGYLNIQEDETSCLGIEEKELS